MPKITNITGREIRDSRGNPTLEVEVFTERFSGKCEVPSGASKGKREAWELRDESGGMSLALKALEEIDSALRNFDVLNQKEIDKKLIELDGTENKRRLGGNTLVGTSIAVAKAAAKESGLELYQYVEKISGQERSIPRIFANLIEGGKHAKTPLSFQEYHLIPSGENLEKDIEIVRKIQDALMKKSFVKGIGDEGGAIIESSDPAKPLEELSKIAQELDLEDRVRWGLDVAATSFHTGGEYSVGNKKLDRENMIALIEKLARDYDLFSIEDPLEEEDFAGFAKLKMKMPGTMIIGDDLTVTNAGRLEEALDRESIGGIILKPNQTGTLSETIDAVRLAKSHGIKCIASHRSGETLDTFISDLAVGLGCFGVKIGAYNTEVRIAKYDRLFDIWQKDQGLRS